MSGEFAVGTRLCRNNSGRLTTIFKIVVPCASDFTEKSVRNRANEDPSYMPFLVRFFTFFSVVALPVFFCFAALPVQAADIDVVEQNIREFVLNDSVPDDAAVAECQNTLTAGESPYGGKKWADIEYANTQMASWPVTLHLKRMLLMARAYCRSDSSFYQNESLKNDILSALDFWIARKPKSTNWFANELAVQQQLGPIMLLMKDKLSSSQKSSGLGILANSYVARSVNTSTNTGANRIERANCTIYRALLIPSSALLSESFGAIGDTILIADDEGIRQDYSFAQHGPQLYISDYGISYLSGIIKAASWNFSTSYAFSDDQMKILVDYALDGAQRFIRGNTIDFTAGGRALSRDGNAANAEQMTPLIEQLIFVTPDYRLGELLKFFTRLQADVQRHAADPATAFTGNKMFWCADSMTQQCAEFYASVRMCSVRSARPERGNGESLKCLYLGDGVTPIMRTGNEYDNIMPVWDWYRLPGTTAVQGTYSLNPTTEWEIRGNTSHVGGVSDGIVGTAVFDYSKTLPSAGTVTGKKSWFFFEDGFVALGAGITGTGTSGNINTTLNQTLRNGTITRKTGDTQSVFTATGEQALPATQWVHHDGVGYVFPEDNTTAVIKAATQTGTWYSLNTSQSTAGVSKDVFTLLLNHGQQPINARYAYIVLPGKTPEETDAWRAAKPIEILQNDTVAQAVRRTGTGVTMANFWTAGSVPSAGISTDAPVSILMQRDAEGVNVYLSNPAQNGLVITVNINTAVGGVAEAEAGMIAERTSDGLAKITFFSGLAGGQTRKVRFNYASSGTDKKYEIVTLPAIADTFVWDKNRTTNYGRDIDLYVKTTTGAGSNYEREAYFRFDASNIARTPVWATFRVVPSVTSKPATSGLASCANNWDEYTTTWNTKPARGTTTYASWVPAPLVAGTTGTGYPILADALPAVIDALNSGNANKTFSLTIYPVSAGNGDAVAYHSRETPDAANRPSLLLFFERDPNIIPVEAAPATVTPTATTPGRFTFTRSGNIAGDIAVNYTLSGDAVSGTDYVALPASVTIPAGQTSVDLPLTPLFSAGESREKNLTLSLTDGSGSATAKIFLLNAAGGWRMKWFGTYKNTGDAADNANPAGDGMDNFMKYALGANPLKNAVDALPYAKIAGNSQEFFDFYFQKNNAAGDVIYTVEQSVDLKIWTEVNVAPELVADNGEISRMVVRVPTNNRERLFLRLRLQRITGK